MTDVLYIDCCIRGEQSRTKRLGEAFLAALLRQELPQTVSRLRELKEFL